MPTYGNITILSFINIHWTQTYQGKQPRIFDTTQAGITLRFRRPSFPYIQYVKFRYAAYRYDLGFFFQNLFSVIWPICQIFFRSFELFFGSVSYQSKMYNTSIYWVFIKENEHKTKFAKQDHKNKAF